LKPLTDAGHVKNNIQVLLSRLKTNWS